MADDLYYFTILGLEEVKTTIGRDTRPFRGLRKVYRGLDETTLLKVVIMRMLEDGYQGNGQDSRSEI